ncbi:hypothetical protein [Streptomyces griseoaurantiacus]|uniref:hypothetical protein n=1 Tax=Streptomyces griseoaurantiacus TaxID=68213 RepID=UPI0036A3866E
MDPRTKPYPHGPANHNGYQSVMWEARLGHDPYDQWGWAKEWLASIAEVLIFDMGESVPQDVYRPGAGQSEPEPDSYSVDAVRSAVTYGADADDLRRAMNVMDRFAEALDAAGQSY